MSRRKKVTAVKPSLFEALNQSKANQSGIANTSGVQNYLMNDDLGMGNSIVYFPPDEDGQIVDEETEIEYQQLMEGLEEIFMDLGPVSRELAPLKLERPKEMKLKSKTILKVKALPSVADI